MLSHQKQVPNHLAAVHETCIKYYFITVIMNTNMTITRNNYHKPLTKVHQFYWQSQNSDALFVRESKEDGFGNTNPFYCFGLVDYISSRDDKPMSINWRMHQPIMAKFVNAV